MDHTQENIENEANVTGVDENKEKNTRRDSQSSDSSVYYDIEDDFNEDDRNNNIPGEETNVGNSEKEITFSSTEETISSPEMEQKENNEKIAVESEVISTVQNIEATQMDNENKKCLAASNNQPETTKSYTLKLTLDQPELSDIPNNELELLERKELSQMSLKSICGETNSLEYQNLTREAYMFNVIFPELNQFGIEKSFQVLQNVVRPYHLQQGDIVWNTVGTDGYKMWKREDLMDMRHMILVLTSCGKWHGSVMAFKDQSPRKFKQFTEKLYNVMQKYLANDDVMKTITKNFEKVICMLKGIGRSDLAEKYKKTAGLFGDILLSNNVKYSVIALHADFWVDSIMFKEEVADTTSNQMFFSNFQLPMMDSPMRDLSYIIYCYGDKILFEDFDFLMHAYYASLSETLLRLGSDPDQVFPYEKMKREWKKYGMFGVLMTLLEVFDESEEDFEKEVDKDQHELMQKHKLYNKRIADVFNHYGEHFL